MPPSLNSDHKISSGDIFVEIKNYLKKNPIGVVLSAPLDVYFDEKSNSVQPDIIFILKENLSMNYAGHFQYTPCRSERFACPGPPFVARVR